MRRATLWGAVVGIAINLLCGFAPADDSLAVVVRIIFPLAVWSFTLGITSLAAHLIIINREISNVVAELAQPIDLSNEDFRELS